MKKVSPKISQEPQHTKGSRIEMSVSKENQLKELVQVTADPSIIPTGQQDTLLTHFDELTKEFPYNAALWASYIKLKIYKIEQEGKGELVLVSPELEKIIGKSIQHCNSFEIWFQYLRYVKLKNNIVVNGKDARNIIIEAYNAIWNKCFSKDMETDVGYEFIHDYLKFLNEWQPQDKYEKHEKSQHIRKVYCQSFSFPIKNIEKVWAEYNNWEQALDPIKCRKQISQVSGEYMKSRGLFIEWQTKMSKHCNSQGSIIPTLQYYLDWIEWEKEKQLAEVEARCDYIYKQALQKMMFQEEKAWYCYSLSQIQFEKKISILEGALACLPESLALTIYLSELYEKHDKNLYIEKIKEIFEKLIANHDLEKEKGLVSNIYITYMNTMNRIEGLSGSRKVFNKIRLLKDKLDYRVFFENAYIEFRADSKSVTPAKVLELGLKYHTINNCDYVHDYLSFLMTTNQPLNMIKTVFENYDDKLNTSVLDTPQITEKNKGIYKLMIEFELRTNDGNIDNILKLQAKYKSKFNASELELFDIFKETRTENLKITKSRTSLGTAQDDNKLNNFDNILNSMASNQSTVLPPESQLSKDPLQVGSSTAQPGEENPFIELPPELADMLFKLPKSVFFPDEVLKPEMLCKFLRDINIDSITTEE
mgnify:CR=1 FL=1